MKKAFDIFQNKYNQISHWEAWRAWKHLFDFVLVLFSSASGSDQFL